MTKGVQSVLFSVLVVRCCCAPDAANRETSTRRAFIRLPLKVIPVRLP